MSKKKVVLITDFFPYTNIYETFLETEIKYWANQNELELILLPMHMDSYKRETPPNIVIDNSFANFLSIKEKEIEQNLYKFLYILKSIYKPIFWKEIFTEVIKRPSIVKEFLLSMRKYEIYGDFFKKYTRENDIEVFYTYWNTEVTYALQSLNNKSNYSVVTRVHGYDLYEERTFKNYMPLRKQFTKNINQIFTITDKAIEYLVETYGYKKEFIQTSRLGVEDRKIIAKSSLDNNFHIVSCSSLIPLKRVDKIIDILELLVNTRKDIKLKWTHIGAGSLYDELKNYADTKLNNANLECSFLGSLSNQEVYEFYEDTQVDVFLNVSESEGVPVSIMEAMSCHIPIVALDIGGISDMVITNFNGVLLKPNTVPLEIAIILENILYFKNKTIRQNSYKQYKMYYDADKNYRKYIKIIEGIIS